MSTHPDRAQMISCPKAARATRKIEWSTALRCSMADADASAPVVAAHLGISAGQLKRYRNPDAPDMLPVADLDALPPAVFRPLVDGLVRKRGLAVVELPQARELPDDMRLIEITARESGEAVATAIGASSDGIITGIEGAKIVKECDEAIAALLAIREVGARAVREGVVGTRRPKLEVAQ